MHPELITVGPYTLYSYGLLMVSAVVAAILLCRALARRAGVDPQDITRLVVVLAAVGYAGTNLLWVLNRLVTDGPSLRVAWQALVSDTQTWYGALVFGLPCAWWYLRRLGLEPWRTFDILMTALPLGHAVGRIGCFLGGCCYGRPTGSWLGIRFPGVGGGEAVHPTQLYEAAGLALLCAFLLCRFLRRHRNGEVFAAYLLLYPLLKAGVDVFRGAETRQLVLSGALSLNQLISAAMVALAVVLAVLHRRHNQ